ncbi:MAG: MFS transporter [Candidatus Hydrogenedentota bacterium]
MAKASRITAPSNRDFNRRGFWALIATQFQGAFNDNLYQYVIMLLLVARGVTVIEAHELTGVVRFVNSETFVLSFAVVVFSMPFIIFPSLFGALTDRYSKQKVALATKYLEIVVMLLGGVAFYIGNPVFIWVVLFLMGTQSAMFSPAKYGIIPEIMPEPRISWGNGILQMGTIIAIIAGTALAGPLYDALEGQIYFASGILMALSATGILAAHFITRPPAANPDIPIPKNPFLPWAGMGTYFKAIWHDRFLFSVIVGYIYFWFGGILVRQSVLSFGNTTLQLSETYVTPLVASMALGIGIGALAAGYLSRDKIEMGIVPIGAAGMGVFALALSTLGVLHQWFMPTLPEDATKFVSLEGFEGYYVLCVGCMLMLGVFAGLFDVPLAAAIQARAPRNMKGGVIATTNMLTFVGMLIAGVLFGVLGAFQLTSYHIFMVSALMSVAMCIYLIYMLPQVLLRAWMWILTNTLYRIRVLGRGYVPEEGGALLVANHISFVDVLFLYASTDREITFIVGKEVLKSGWIRRFARLLHLILVDTDRDDGPQEALRQARAVLAKGGVVCVSYERRLKADAPPMPYHDDYGVLTEGLDVPVAPVHIARLWGSIYSFDDDGRFHFMRPPHIPYPVMVRYGPQVADTSGAAVRNTLLRMGTDSYKQRPLTHTLLHRGLIAMARRHKRRLCVADAVTGELSFFKTLVGTIAFARKLNQILDKQPCVGLLLPPSVGGTLANAALQLMGRVPVNLNYTASPEAMASAASQCGITQVLTSKKFLERLPLDVPGEALYLEDIREQISGTNRLAALMLALFAPIWLIERAAGSPRKRTSDDLATIIFSSGSEGAPKGVQLTQRNILSNIEAGLETFPHGPDERMMAFLPFFHSFGFTGTLWLMLHSGCGVVFHANPLESRAIGGLVEKYKCTFMIATPTFLNSLMRRCRPEQLQSLAWVVVGAEKLPERLRMAFKTKHGTEPMEGYGTTECAPVVSVNTPDFHSPGFYSVGTRHGTIGRPLPGIGLKVLDPDTGEEAPAGTPGLLHISGPNIMRGYLDLPEKTDEVLKDGWYETGDIAAVDEDGFITITDRLARFSKIAGEMVPHTKVEETLHELLELDEQHLAVSSVADERKGERLVVLHTLSDEQINTLLKKLPQSDLPNLWRPRADAFHRINEIPVLGTGKLDIRGLRTRANELDGEA